MTPSLAAISIGSLLSFAPWAVRAAEKEGFMSTKRRKREQELPVLHPDAAGIDVGASELFVAVPADRDPESVRSFPTFTQDLYELVDWLQHRGHGVHQRLLDTGVPDPGGPRHRGVPGQRTLPQKRSRSKERRFRLPMDSIPAFGWSAAGQLSSARSDLRDSPLWRHRGS